MRVRKEIRFWLIYIVLGFILALLDLMTVSAAEKEVGGPNNAVSIRSTIIDDSTTINKTIFAYDFKLTDDYEAIGYMDTKTSDKFYSVNVIYCKNGKSYGSSAVTFEDFLGTITSYKKSGEINSSEVYTQGKYPSNFYFPYATLDSEVSIICKVTGMKIFRDNESAMAYAKSGSLDGMIKDEYESDWYLKGVDMKVYADDSPTSEAGEDATYIQFNWLTDNLEKGDLLEIKTHNTLKKYGGDEISGFHDYITWISNVSAYDDVFTDKDGNERASYTMGQYDAAKAWFSTLENKPFLFKSYDTDIYYLRPYRNGVYGRWVKVTLNRSTPTSSPDIIGREYGDIDEDGNWKKDDDITRENADDRFNEDGNLRPNTDPSWGDLLDGSADWSDIFRSFFEFMKNIPSLIGELPALVYSVIGFLPSYVIGFIAIGIVVVIILRIVGR